MEEGDGRSYNNSVILTDPVSKAFCETFWESSSVDGATKNKFNHFLLRGETRTEMDPSL